MALVTVDTNPDLKYEKNSILKKILNFFLIPILNSLPRGFHKKIGYTNRPAGKVAENKTTHVALEILYTRGVEEVDKKKPGIFKKAIHSIWFNTNNPKSVRNRLRLVTHLLTQQIKKVASLKTELYILSIASGSARAVVEAIKQSNTESLIHANFLDKNLSALEYSKSLVAKLLIPDPAQYDFRWIEDTAGNFPHHVHENLDIVEMVGLIDYFDDEKVVSLFKKIYSKLNDGGMFVCSNISDNSERRFVDNAIGWKMIYRSGERLAELAAESGFIEKNIEVKYEPLKVHAVLIAHK